MIGAPTTTADLFSQMAQVHFQKTASLVVQASDAYFMGKVAAHSPNLQLELLEKQAAAYEPQMSKVASGYARFLEKLSHTDPERAAYLAKQAGIGSFLGQMAGKAVRGGASAGRGIGRAAMAPVRGVARAGHATRRAVQRVTHRPGSSRFIGPAPPPMQGPPRPTMRQRMGQRWQGFKQDMGTGYTQGARKAATPSTPGFQGPMPAPAAPQPGSAGFIGPPKPTMMQRVQNRFAGSRAPAQAATPNTPGFQGPMPAPPSRGGPYRAAATPNTPGFQGPLPAPGPARPTVRTRRGMRGSAPDQSLNRGQMRDIMNPAPKGTRRVRQRRGMRGAETDPGLSQQQLAASRSRAQSTAQTTSQGADAAREAADAANQAAGLAPSDAGSADAAQTAGQGFRFPWLKAGLLTGAVGVPMVAMKGMETAQNVLGSNMQSPYRAGQGAPQHWNRAYQF